MTRSDTDPVPRSRPLLVFVLFACMLQACGQTGPLFLPDSTPPGAARAPTPDNAPGTAAQPPAQPVASGGPEAASGTAATGDESASEREPEERLDDAAAER